MSKMNWSQWLRLAIQVAILALSSLNHNQIGEVQTKVQSLNSRAVDIPAESPPESEVK